METPQEDLVLEGKFIKTNQCWTVKQNFLKTYSVTSSFAKIRTINV